LSPADVPDPRYRILGLAVQIAAYAPARRNKYAYEARVPWRLIIELRAALGDAGIDWREMHVARGAQDAGIAHARSQEPPSARVAVSCFKGRERPRIPGPLLVGLAGSLAGKRKRARWRS
jgi:hypothetical protein